MWAERGEEGGIRSGLSMTVLELLNRSSGILNVHQIENPRLNAELLLAQSLGMTREVLYVNFSRVLDAAEQEAFEKLLRRRISGEPLQYILGRQEFWSIHFKVDSRVLIPRPETERLVEEALHILQAIAARGRSFVLEVGTGSGAIAVSLAQEVKDIFLVATDISREALALARENARTAGCHRIQWVNGDLLKPFRIGGKTGVFDLIVFNPPYVSRSDTKALAREVREHEPLIALNGGPDGLDFYRAISQNVSSCLRKGGWLLLEIGPGQGRKVSEMLRAQKVFSAPELVCDFAGIERVVKAQKVGEKER